MTNREIIRHIDNGANYYVGLFGEAIHIEKVDKKYYSYIKPKAGEQGITFIYDVRINDIPTEQIKTVVDEMKSMNMPIWFGLLASDEAALIFSGKEPTHDKTETDENDEIYMAILPEDKREYRENNYKIIKVYSAEEFALWAQIADKIFLAVIRVYILLIILLGVKKRE